MARPDQSELYRVLAESAPDAIVAIDEGNTVLSVNAAAERIFGYTAAEIVGKSLHLLMPERMRPRHDVGMQRYLTTGMRRIPWQGVRVAIRTKSGTEIPVEISFGEFNENGRRFFAGFIRDVSERAASERALAEANELLQAQAAELELQVEEARTLTEEVEHTNEGLRIALNQADSARLAAEESEARFRRTADSAPVLIWTVTPNGTRDWANEPWQRFAGHAVDDVLDGRWMKALHPDDREAYDVSFGQAFASRAGFSAEYRLLRHDGEYRWILDNSVPRFAASGEFLGYVGSGVDITDRRRATESMTFLVEATRVLSGTLDFETRLRNLVRHIVPFLADYASVDLLTDEGEIRRVETAHRDPALEDIVRDLWTRYPYSARAHVGVPEVIRTAQPILTPTFTEAAIAAFARDDEHLTLLHQLAPQSYIAVPLSVRGHVFGALSLVFSDSAHGGSGRRYSTEDLTLAAELGRRAAIAIDNARLFREAEAARDAAEEARSAAISASRAKSDFLAMMSHEIRTPINAVLGYSELLELELSGPLTDEQRTQLGRIRASTRHLLGLVNQVLDLAKIESGRLEVERGEAVTGETVDAALALIRPQAAVRGVALSERCAGARSAVYLGDEHRVRQVLTNLLANAVKFTEAGGSVAVNCAITDLPPRSTGLLADTPYVAFRVTDTGIGIPAEQLGRIFEPYVQAESAGKSTYVREHTGTGLGLSISRQLARLMGGEITVESRKDEGSTFTLWVPALERRSVRRTPSHPSTPASRAHGSEGGDARSELRELDSRTASDEQNEGLQRIAEGLLSGVRPIVEAWVSRLPQELPEPQVKTLSREQLEDHATTFISELGLAIRTLAIARGDDPSGLLQYGSTILRTISEQHGIQRLRLGWSTGSVERELEVFREECDALIRRVGEGEGEGATREASRIIAHLVSQARRISLASYRLAEGDQDA